MPYMKGPALPCGWLCQTHRILSSCVLFSFQPLGTDDPPRPLPSASFLHKQSLIILATSFHKFIHSAIKPCVKQRCSPSAVVRDRDTRPLPVSCSLQFYSGGRADLNVWSQGSVCVGLKMNRRQDIKQGDTGRSPGGGREVWLEAS